MDQILKFTTALIIFLSLFLIIVSSTSEFENPFNSPLKTKHECEKDKDCPIMTYYLFAWCVQKFCEYH
ncbi:hypothetical protein P8452_31109 [Trifolium repens]|nr:hypothetical protein P8452_31109 [Trifolium repens]